MEDQSLFSGKTNIKNVINLSSAEFAQRSVKVKLCIKLSKEVLTAVF